jgi:hypothetical protein
MARDLPTAELERVLLDVGSHLEEPPPVDLALMVGARLRDRTAAPVIPIRRRLFPRPVTWRSVAVIAAAVVVLLAGIMVFSPGARRAVAGWLGLRGVRIEVVPPTPSASPPPSGPQTLDLGPRVSLPEAEREVGFRVLLPGDPALGAPDEIHVQPLYISEQVFLVYRARPGFHITSETGVALLVSEFRARPDGDYFKKVSANGGVEFVEVHGEPGYWIEGAHEVSYLDAHGIPIQDTTRLAGNVLVWQHGDLTLRLESSLILNEALRIARSFA